jgi:hypothetical protein
MVRNVEKKRVDEHRARRAKLPVPVNITGQIKRLFAADYKLCVLAGLSHEQALAMCLSRYEKFAE